MRRAEGHLRDERGPDRREDTSLGLPGNRADDDDDDDDDDDEDSTLRMSARRRIRVK